MSELARSAKYFRAKLKDETRNDFRTFEENESGATVVGNFELGDSLNFSELHSRNEVTVESPRIRVIRVISHSYGASAPPEIVQRVFSLGIEGSEGEHSHLRGQDPLRVGAEPFTLAVSSATVAPTESTGTFPTFLSEIPVRGIRRAAWLYAHVLVRDVYADESPAVPPLVSFSSLFAPL